MSTPYPCLIAPLPSRILARCAHVQHRHASRAVQGGDDGDGERQTRRYKEPLKSLLPAWRRGNGICEPSVAIRVCRRSTEERECLSGGRERPTREMEMGLKHRPRTGMPRTSSSSQRVSFVGNPCSASAGRQRLLTGLGRSTESDTYPRSTNHSIRDDTRTERNETHLPASTAHIRRPRHRPCYMIDATTRSIGVVIFPKQGSACSPPMLLRGREEREKKEKFSFAPMRSGTTHDASTTVCSQRAARLQAQQRIRGEAARHRCRAHGMAWHGTAWHSVAPQEMAQGVVVSLTMRNPCQTEEILPQGRRGAGCRRKIRSTVAVACEAMDVREHRAVLRGAVLVDGDESLACKVCIALR